MNFRCLANNQISVVYNNKHLFLTLVCGPGGCGSSSGLLHLPHWGLPWGDSSYLGHTVLHSAMQAGHGCFWLSRPAHCHSHLHLTAQSQFTWLAPTSVGWAGRLLPWSKDICSAIQSTRKETEQTQVFIKGCTQRKRKRKGTSNYKTVDCVLVTAVLFKIDCGCSESISGSYSAGSWHPASVPRVPCHHERANYCLHHGVLLLRISLSFWVSISFLYIPGFYVLRACTAS